MVWCSYTVSAIKAIRGEALTRVMSSIPFNELNILRRTKFISALRFSYEYSSCSRFLPLHGFDTLTSVRCVCVCFPDSFDCS